MLSRILSPKTESESFCTKGGKMPGTLMCLYNITNMALFVNIRR